MSGEPQSLRTTYAGAEKTRSQLEAFYDTNAASYQDSLKQALSQYRQCLQLAESIALFSPNESLEDISTNDLQYILLNYRIAELSQRQNTGSRKLILQDAQRSYDTFLRLLDNYDILTASDARLYEQYREAPVTFSTAPSDPTARREAKIRRFKEEKQLKQGLEYLQRNPAATQDDEIHRKLRLAQIAYSTHQTFQALESIAQELHILSLAPPESARNPERTTEDARDRERTRDGYSERLDAPMSAGLTGPLLDAQGRPMRPFTLLGKRQDLQAGVFRPDHSLPTMSIDEYLEEEKRRGGMIEGGGPQSGIKPEVDEDDLDKADEETMKARAWDEFVEANPKGAGNTINRG